MPDPLPGKGFLGWLGRQVGYVSKAVKSESGQSKKLYESRTVQQQPHPADPKIILRRTTIDEVIETRKPPCDT